MLLCMPKIEDGLKPYGTPRYNHRCRLCIARAPCLAPRGGPRRPPRPGAHRARGPGPGPRSVFRACAETADTNQDDDVDESGHES